MTGKIVKLGDFARECGVSERAIQKHLKRLEQELDGHFERKGTQGTWLDEVAQECIRSHLQTAPPPVIADNSLLRENEELRNKLISMQERYIQLQSQLVEQVKIAAEAEMNIKLLESAEAKQREQEKEIMEERNQKDIALTELESVKEKLRAAEVAAAESAAALDRERVRKLTFLERLTGKRSDKFESAPSNQSYSKDE